MTTPRAELDHLVVGAASLDEGRRWCRDVLGVEATTGGSHEGLGTHNVLLALGDRRYLEVIAVDPDAPAPTGSRWFGLDTEQVRARLQAGPTILTWVARCVGDDDAVVRLTQTQGYGPVDVRAASRGELRWRFSFSSNGDLLGGGVVPPLIQWDSPAHPTDRLPDVGLALQRLELRTPDTAGTSTLLAALGLEVPPVTVVAGGAPGLEALLTAPDGEVVIA